METLAYIMWTGISVMVVGTAYILWKNRDIFTYEPK